MTSALLARAESAGLSLALDGEDLVIEGPQGVEAEAVAIALLAEEQRVILALRVLDLAATRRYQVAIIVDGYWQDRGQFYDATWQARNGARSRKLHEGKVIHFGEASWRAFVDGAPEAQLREAVQILQASAAAMAEAVY
jgi:hypothetical protein